MTNNIIHTDVLALNQITNKQLFIGTLTVDQIISIIRYSDRKSIVADPIAKNISADVLKEQYYQRLKSSDRAYEIKLFILKQIYYKHTFTTKLISPLALFPSAIILGCETYSEIKTLDKFEEVVKDNFENNKSNEFVFIEKSKIYIPRGKNTLIVDGQHRIAGMENLLDEAKSGEIIIKNRDIKEYEKIIPPVSVILDNLSSFQFLVTFLIDFDRFEQAELFANVNFNQKPVNKSFYYDIFGSLQREKTIEKLLHDLTASLNYSSASPLKNRIKMLGTGDGNFSQAFFVEALFPLFKNGIFTSVFVDFQENGDEFKKLPKFLRAYFSSFFDIFKNYLEDTIILKTTGMGGIIKLLPAIYKKIGQLESQNVLSLSEEKLKQEISKIISPLKKHGDNYFGKESRFSKGAGKGLQSSFYNQMLSDLKL